MHSPCANFCCADCFTASATCPHCHDTGDVTRVIPRFVLDTLAGLKVHCPACQTVVARANYDEHAQSCPRPCERGCGETVTPSQRLEHDAVCGAVAAHCSAFGCGLVVMRRDLDAHRDGCAFVAIDPALRAILALIAARLDAQNAAFEARLAARLDEQNATFEARLDAQKATFEARLAALEQRISHKKKRARHVGTTAESPPARRTRNATTLLGEQGPDGQNHESSS